MLQKLGFQPSLADKSPANGTPADEDTKVLVQLTLELLLITQINYHHFFQALQQQFCSQWREDFTLVFADLSVLTTAGWHAQGSVSDLANALTS